MWKFILFIFEGYVDAFQLVWATQFASLPNACMRKHEMDVDNFERSIFEGIQ